jgi:glutathione peroxidase
MSWRLQISPQNVEFYNLGFKRRYEFMAKIDFGTSLTTLSGESTTLAQFEGKVLLVVNTASKCGLTPQYKGLQMLHENYQEKGLVILGFPCNQFMGQEPGSKDEIESFCQKNYGVEFFMHEKIEVNGDNTHPLYVQLKNAKSGILGTKEIKWNFSKFLIGRDGEVLERYAPKTEIASFTADIEKALGV